jgi:2,4-dienoyl-CoA reductase-like NADH-dependent reductase (Old Yellow Enzyme family)
MPPQDFNNPVPGLEYFTPQHITSPGSLPQDALSKSAKPTPTLFTPLTIRSKTLRNRIILAPMCQYSTSSHGPTTGCLTDYHIATLGHYALKGASLVFIEATGVQANGRISPNCPGLWTDAQIPALRRVSDFVKSQGALAGIQLAHAGRKASTCAPWIAGAQKTEGGKRKVSLRAGEDVGGWPTNVVGPMGGDEWAWDMKAQDDEESGYWPPRALSEREVGELVNDWAKAAERAVKAGIDVIEIHAAHGYLIHQFLSPVSNQRNDKYGGSFENRTRLLLEIVQAIRKVIPDSMPLFVRLSTTEWMEGTELGKNGSWDVESTIRLAKLLPALGVDLLDASSGGNHPVQRINPWNSMDYQTLIAARIRTEVKNEGLKLLIGAVGLITEAEQARDIIEEGGAVKVRKADAEMAQEVKAAVGMTEKQDGKEPMADVILVARQFMREPEWVLKVAWQLGVDVAWPNQFLRVRFPKL